MRKDVCVCKCQRILILVKPGYTSKQLVKYSNTLLRGLIPTICSCFYRLCKQHVTVENVIITSTSTLLISTPCLFLSLAQPFIFPPQKPKKKRKKKLQHTNDGTCRCLKTTKNWSSVWQVSSCSLLSYIVEQLISWSTNFRALTLKAGFLNDTRERVSVTY